ncbi:sulfatase-like hydrolase/transferase [Runella slithyformis]|uniref:Sulfatase n=1 Tax=Runella slithyformis (strain ATCC 29530 / DSM 19594 / LMG 11500 / NCIMB 11436 / LSU 4) TaxID=761193 RepID=A0A7U4E480_RUNSL|nr:sulfatase-like hydrolase/transferase [Runella slithyformis]AEI47231.1 sulfatase [Runella slithyformis DSM 19594]
MNRNLFLLLCSLLYSSLHAQSSKPNILFLFADDLRADALGCYGNPYVQTPNLDQLARNGTIFTEAHILGGNHGAVCAPSRAMLMSGKGFFRVLDKLNGVTTWPMLMRQNGYSTFMTGKWHNEPAAVGASFMEAKNVMLGGMADHYQTPMSDLKPDGTFTEPVKKGFSTDHFAETAIQFLDKQTANKPFVTYVAFTAPHDPRSPLPEYLKRYGTVPLPPNFMPIHPFNFGSDMTVRDEMLAGYPRTTDVIKSQLTEYYAMITHLDEAIGKILAKLKEKGLDKNTIIVFAADNGLAMGSHGLLGKQNLYEHSMRVPLIMSGKGIPQHQKSDAFVYLFDLFPTFCKMLNIKAPTDLEGKDLSGIIHGKMPSVREQVFTAYTFSQRAIRDRRWKLIRYPKVDFTQLFDLQTDPHELNNLAQKPEYAARVKTMMENLKKHQQQYGDTFPLTASEISSQVFDYKNVVRKPDQWQPKEVLEKYFKD